MYCTFSIDSKYCIVYYYYHVEKDESLVIRCRSSLALEGKLAKTKSISALAIYVYRSAPKTAAGRLILNRRGQRDGIIASSRSLKKQESGVRSQQRNAHFARSFVRTVVIGSFGCLKFGTEWRGIEGDLNPNCNAMFCSVSYPPTHALTQPHTHTKCSQSFQMKRRFSDGRKQNRDVMAALILNFFSLTTSEE